MIRYITLFLLSVSVAVASQSDYYTSQVIVKFKENSNNLYQKIIDGNSTTIDDFSALIGTHSAKLFLNPIFIHDMKKRKSNSFKTSIRSYLRSGSDRIFLVEYQNAIDPKVVSSKLRSFPFVEYAEPVYKRETTSTPNDPQAQFQYHLETIRAFDAWDQITSTDSVVIGIVDTGLDYEHEDIKQNIWFNNGEMGIDALGNSKQVNGIDDDNNGYIDDFRGWDFVSDSLPEIGDNNPKPGNEHGTHVAGIAGATVNNAIGVAGVGNRVKLLPVKIGYDSPFSTSVTKGFDGIAYAAMVGARVINCSWGGGSFSQSEQDLINDITDNYNVIIVSAAGNSSENTGFYPASYDNVISVASTRQDDKKSDFSNYYKLVDVSAPGSDIFSTVPNNSYRTLSGTSMASPVIAGVVALTVLQHPNFSSEQITEHIKSTSDDIKASNDNSFDYLLGSGRVNLFRAITEKNVKAVIPFNVKFANMNGESLFYNNDTVIVNFSLKNILDSLSKVSVHLSSYSKIFKPTILKDSVFLGAMIQDEIKESIQFQFVIPSNAQNDEEFSMLCTIKDDDSKVKDFIITLFLNPTYRTISDNNIAVTVNSIGNFGYNDYSSNVQGDGFTFKNSSNLLFESSLMIGTSINQLSNVARGFIQESADKGFEIDKIISINKSENSTLQNVTVAHAEYSDRSNLTKVGVEVSQKVYQSSNTNDSNFILSVFTFKNNSPIRIDNFHAGLFFDWDIGPGGTPNIASFNSNKGTGILKHFKIDSLPKVGVRLLSPYKLHYFAIDNNGSTPQNPGIYDGFSTSEKWRMISSGIERTVSNPTDASFVISAGPITIPANGSVEVAYSLAAGATEIELEKSLDSAVDFAKSKGVTTGEYVVPSTSTVVFLLYPNPTDKTVGSILEYELDRYSFVHIDLIDNLGRIIIRIEETEKTSGKYSTVINTNGLATGTYYVRFNSIARSAAQILTVY